MTSISSFPVLMLYGHNSKTSGFHSYTEILLNCSDKMFENEFGAVYLYKSK